MSRKSLFARKGIEIENKSDKATGKKAAKVTDRRLGVCPNREILNGPARVILSLGLWTSISPPGVCRARARALGVGV